ncbi:unnamed protein product [Discula destructiva]
MDHVYSCSQRLRMSSAVLVLVFIIFAGFQVIQLARDMGCGPFAYHPANLPTEQCKQQDHGAGWDDYSIKPIAYVFPQFHAIPENDKFWGPNFTEWVNVKKAKENVWGIETVQPTKEIGYYNLLDYDVRKRYAKLVRDSGIYGLAYHHYWFGHPVMDKPLLAMLEDGQPDVPFMLSWANEPWTVRWDGLVSVNGTLLAQDYGSSIEWRKHFDWMATFFRHPDYIRSGGKVQLAVYSPMHIGDTGKRMFAKWRRWAAKDPVIGGLDIIETLWAWDDPADRGQTDAINEFLPHSGGGNDMTAWERNGRLGSVYHRGALVSWDNTPRHVNDGKADSTVWVHPELWKQSLIGIMRHIKLDPNPRGQENFLFINALNEWGEGNVLEPSIQWGSDFSKALRAAKDYADTSLPWVDDVIRQGEELEPEVLDDKSQVDVCVVIRDLRGEMPWSTAWQLQHTLWSLQAQHNPRWRAVVVPVGSQTEMRGIESQVLDTYDPRIRAFTPASDGLNPNSSDEVTDWVIHDLDRLDPSCGRATYMLVTNAATTYEPHTFDVASPKQTDIIGLNFVSPSTMKLQNEREENVEWNQRCSRYSDKTPAQLCQRMVADQDAPDISAALVNLARWRRESHKFKAAADRHGDSVHLLAELESRNQGAWAWAAPSSSRCDVLHADTYPACIRTGHMWFDGPDVGGFDAGCHSGASLQLVFGEVDVPVHWDYKRFKQEDPLCVRLSEERYNDVLAGKVVAPGPDKPEEEEE